MIIISSCEVFLFYFEQLKSYGSNFFKVNEKLHLYDNVKLELLGYIYILCHHRTCQNFGRAKLR